MRHPHHPQGGVEPDIIRSREWPVRDARLSAGAEFFVAIWEGDDEAGPATGVGGGWGDGLFRGVDFGPMPSIYHPHGWWSGKMAETGSEKITINLGYIDLGHVDLLVQDGFYANRTDFIRTAIRNQIARHAEATQRSVTRRSLDLGLRHFTRADLEAARDAGERLEIRVLGLATIAADVSAELARASIASVSVLGVLQASAAVKAALADRTG